MKTLATLALACLALTGCVVAPVGPPPGPGVAVVPPGVVYVAPTYPMPAPGYVWQYHAHYGWGWFNPNRGWHRGWDRGRQRGWDRDRR